MTQPKKKVLGRGLEALLPAMSESSQGQISMIRVDRIEPNPHQPRQEWDEDELRSLSDSIREQGILQPLVLRRQNLRYQVIAGERRLRAARMAGLEEVPAVLREATDAQMLAWALVENIQRRDLGPLEKAEAFGRLSSLFNLTQEEMGRQTGLDRSTVSNLMRLLELPEGNQGNAFGRKALYGSRQGAPRPSRCKGDRGRSRTRGVERHVGEAARGIRPQGLASARQEEHRGPDRRSA